MSDVIEDLLVTGGVLWLFSSLLKGLVVCILGVYIIFFTVYSVCREMHQIIKEVRKNRSTAGMN